jgi:hypothetical protein
MEAGMTAYGPGSAAVAAIRLSLAMRHDEARDVLASLDDGALEAVRRAADDVAGHCGEELMRRHS